MCHFVVQEPSVPSAHGSRPTGMKDINVKDIEFNQILQVLELCQVGRSLGSLTSVTMGK